MDPELALFALGAFLMFVALPLLGRAARRGSRPAHVARACLAPAWVVVCWLLLVPPAGVVLLGVALSLPLAVVSYRVGDGPDPRHRAVP